MALSTPQPEFKHKGFYTWPKCLLLHRLIIEGKGEEVLRRRQELNPSILRHTCESGWGYKKLTALHFAAWYKSSVPVVIALLEAGSDPNKRDGVGQSALHVAAYYDNPQIIPTLV